MQRVDIDVVRAGVEHGMRRRFRAQHRHPCTRIVAGHAARERRAGDFLNQIALRFAADIKTAARRQQRMLGEAGRRRLQEGMTGDPSILIAKAFLDFFTATIFATTLGIAVAAICVPMLLIQLALATCATLILPLTTPAMMADFTAVGGLLLLATGLRICGIKMFAVVNMLPALLIAMPLSALWTHFFA